MRKSSVAVCAVILLWSTTTFAADPKTIVGLINDKYGRVCTATLEGWVSKTLKIDWTASTIVLHVIKIYSEIASVKEDLYEGGVRYFKFPNKSGGYNIIDWRTGKAKRL